jgi:hypothetical protein
VAAGGGPHASPRDGDLVAGSVWILSRRVVSRRGCQGGRLAEGCRRGGIVEVVSRRAVGEVSRVAISGGSLGAGISGLVSQDGISEQTSLPERKSRA